MLKCWVSPASFRYSITPIFHHSNTPVVDHPANRKLSIIRLIELHAILLARPLFHETLRFRVDLESFLDRFFQAITPQ